MGFDDGCNTGLVLGLGFTATAAALDQTPLKPCTTTDHDQRSKKTCLRFGPLAAAPTSFEPSLTLSLSGETYQVTGKMDMNKVCEEAAADLYRQPSPHSTVSSFSNASVKRERDLGSEEVEIERLSSRVSDEDEDGSNGRKKLRLTKEQSALLEESFKQHSTLNPVISPSLFLNRFLLLWVFVYELYKGLKLMAVFLIEAEAKASFSKAIKSTTSTSWSMVPEQESQVRILYFNSQKQNKRKKPLKKYFYQKKRPMIHTTLDPSKISNTLGCLVFHNLM